MADYYTIGAAKVLGIPEDKVRPQDRQAYKEAFLSHIYSVGKSKMEEYFFDSQREHQ